ncbi:hypothetical protein NDU88_005594 [Pleurodeles waltl]|uniref:Uncharacterized protein n=1 Tax=Pleurodeles waltl TaxID=8319 RepID=A0AAV7WY42_PLEWA|nr:hypothetical protein NDU88_005594 [Pleurodeles waltl]
MTDNKLMTGNERGRNVMLICGDFNTLSCDAINNSEILMQDRSLGIPETAMHCFKPTKKAEAFTDLLLNNCLRFANGHTKSDVAAKATFDNGRCSSVIDYVIVNVEARKSILDMAVVNRVENNHNPLVLSMRTSAIGLENMTRRAPEFYECEIALSYCRRRIRWDFEKYLRELPQLEYIMAVCV